MIAQRGFRPLPRISRVLASGVRVLQTHSGVRVSGSGVLVRRSGVCASGSGVLARRSGARASGSGVLVSRSGARASGSGVLVSGVGALQNRGRSDGSRRQLVFIGVGPGSGFGRGYRLRHAWMRGRKTRSMRRRRSTTWRCSSASVSTELSILPGWSVVMRQARRSGSSCQCMASPIS